MLYSSGKKTLFRHYTGGQLSLTDYDVEQHGGPLQALDAKWKAYNERTSEK